MTVKYTLDDLLYLMSRLREPEYGCPWDLAQNYESITASTIEEAYEVVDAIEQGDRPQLRDELGDLLFQVVFYSQLGSEEGAFSFDDVASAVTEKLIRRHPHVFPDGTLESRITLAKGGSENVGVDASDLDAQNDKALTDQKHDAVKSTWEQIKQVEREQKGFSSVLDDVPNGLPAILRALKLQKRAASVGFEWPSTDGVFEKMAEELDELKEARDEQDADHIEDELGDVLFTAVNLARYMKINPETALRKANRKFERRFRAVENSIESDGLVFSEQNLDDLEVRWQQVKMQQEQKT